MEKNIYKNEKPKKTLHSSESDRGDKLVYTDEFKTFVAEHPGYLNAISGTIDYMSDKQITSASADHEPIDIKSIYMGGNSNTFKVTLNETGECFFVKQKRQGEDPYREIFIMEYARKLLKDIPWVRVADYQCGYLNAEGRGYYVAKWDESMTKSFAYIYNDLEAQGRDDLLQDATIKLNLIKDKLLPLGFGDVSDKNITYDTETGEVVIYDFRLDKGISPQKKLEND